MKILALDIGDKWTGSAISDALGMFARPYKTVETKDLKVFLAEVIAAERIKAVVVGHPKTMRGTQSEQTKKIQEIKKQLEQKFAMVEWKLWDERLSSKRAAHTKKAKTKEDKRLSHSIAAAFILDSYLTFLHSQKGL